MSTEIKDQTKRRAQIKLLEAVIAQTDAAIVTQNLILENLERKLIRQCTELRMQKLFLVNAERAAAKARSGGLASAAV